MPTGWFPGADEGGGAPQTHDHEVAITGVSPAPPASTRPADEGRREALWWAVTRIVLPVLAVLVAVEAHETVVTGMVHGRARDHLVRDYAAAAESATLDGRAHGAIQIPSVGINEIVIEGDTDSNMRAGPAHRPSSAPIGDAGNTVILGHFHRYGGPFARLADAKVGDPVFGQVRNGPVRQYVIASVSRVGPSETGALAPHDDLRLTLVTSAGRFTADRLVVTAVMGPQGVVVGEGNGFDTRRSSVVFSPGMAGAYVMVVIGLASLAWLRRRHRLTLAIGLSLPPLLLGLVLVLRSLELVLPATL